MGSGRKRRRRVLDRSVPLIVVLKRVQMTNPESGLIFSANFCPQDVPATHLKRLNILTTEEMMRQSTIDAEKRDHGDWVFCNVDFKEKQSKWGRSCRWKSRERFLWTHSILQGLGWGSVVALTYSLYQGWGDLQHLEETKTLSSVDVLHKPDPVEAESKVYIEEHAFDAQESITGSDASYKLENELPIEEPVKVFDVKEVGRKSYYEDSNVTQDNFSNDSGHSSGTNRPSIQQEKEQDNNEDFDDDLKKILDEGIQDIRILQGELRSAIEEDFARSNESSSPGAALVYFQVGTMLGDPDSTFNLALCHHFGRGVKQDMKKARNLYEAASRKGHGGATFNLAILVSQGQGGSANLPRARRLLALAAERGVEEARIALQQIDEEEESENDVYKEGGLSRTQSEPTLSSAPSSNWSSSYSTTDLDILEDSLGFVSMEINARTRPVFHLT
ncbi:hypothetical protein C7M84_019264 [Penaeus vannamei]|uniref:Death ligand signal enhancer n=1 Tax=Penaeus vannamei TaxID=6689 RepID=A0A423SFC7_PENVA|nr:hypothetical protein C7M84_019264 [Penaeus vannamei]